jgi:hypothetical protein
MFSKNSMDNQRVHANNRLIADPPKIGTALLIKFGDNSDNKKKHFLHLAREISFTHFTNRNIINTIFSFIL